MKKHTTYCSILVLVCCTLLHTTTYAQKRGGQSMGAILDVKGNDRPDTRVKFFVDNTLLSNDTIKIGQFLNTGIDVNSLGREPFPAATILMVALERSNASTIECLLKRGANPNLRVRTSYTPMFARQVEYETSPYPIEFAAESGDVEKLDVMVRYGADMSKCLESIKNHATQRGSTQMMEYIAKKTGSSKVQPNVLAVMTEENVSLDFKQLNTHFINDMIRKGANPNAYSPQGRTALINVISNRWITNKAELIPVLIQNGANPDKGDIDDPTRKGIMKFYSHTPLLVAIRAGRLDLVKILVENGANVNYSPTQSDSPLKSCNDDKITEYLILKGAR